MAESEEELKSLLMKVKEEGEKVDKGPSSLSYGFSSSHVQMWEVDYKEN